MKLNKIASAFAAAGLLSSAAFADVINAPDASAGVSSSVVAGQVVVTGSSTLTNTAGTTQTATRADVATGVSQKTTTFSTPTSALGNSTTPVQGTMGGPGGVSGAGAIAASATTAYFSGTTNTIYQPAGTVTALLPIVAGGVYSTSTSIASGTAYLAGSVIGGVTMAANGTTAGATTVLAGDHLITQNVIKSGVAYAAGSIIGGVTMAVAGTTAANTNVLAGDKLIVTATAASIGTGLKGTDHDFASKVTTGQTATAGLCTYCHTPHKGATTLLLWNHTMSSNTFQWDVAATTAGTALPSFSGTNYKGPSAKCLACHDGTIAIGDINWFNQSARTGSGNLMPGKMADIGGTAKLVGSATGDLTGVHPVAIPYPLNGAPNVYNGSTSGARVAMNDFVADPTANNIRLYSDVGGGNIVGKVQAGKTGIECSSCHDVHNKAATDKFFLRGKLVGSSAADGYLCAQCHTK